MESVFNDEVAMMGLMTEGNGPRAFVRARAGDRMQPGRARPQTVRIAGLSRVDEQASV